jgi:hypothetical protein
MPAEDVTVNIVYTAIPVVVPDAGNVANDGNDGNDNDGNGQVANNAAANAVAANADDGAQAAVTTDAADGVIEPNADGGYDLTPIEDAKTPLANLDLDNHSCDIFHFLLMLLSLILFGVYTKSRKNRQLKAAELKEQLATETIQKELNLSDEDMAKYLEAAKKQTNA